MYLCMRSRLPLSYSWYRDGRPLPKGTKITNRNRDLTIPNAQLNAEGNYVCKCKRPGATATKIIALQMEGRKYPMWFCGCCIFVGGTFIYQTVFIHDSLVILPIFSHTVFPYNHTICFGRHVSDDNMEMQCCGKTPANIQIRTILF